MPSPLKDFHVKLEQWRQGMVSQGELLHAAFEICVLLPELSDEISELLARSNDDLTFVRRELHKLLQSRDARE